MTWGNPPPFKPEPPKQGKNDHYDPEVWDLSKNKIATTHGMSHYPEFHVWNTMKQRCSNPKNPKYHLYGGRGIKVCDRWLDSFENFIWDMGRRPSDEYSLDRYPNMNGNYEPGNTRWATKLEQANNLRSTKQLTHDGKTQSQAEWARDLGISAITLRERLQNWSLEKALSTPAIRKSKPIMPESLAKGGSEDAHCKALMCWCGQNYEIYPQLRFLAHIPNGGARNVIEGSKFKVMGVRPGFPDYILPIANKYAGLFIEMKIEKRKNEKNGGCSDEQVIWLNHLQSQGYCCRVCYSWTEARDTLVAYLDGRL